MKRFVSILCCLVMILVSIPISVSAEEKSIDYSVQFINATHVSSAVTDGNSKWNEVCILDSTDKCVEFLDNACTDSMSNISTNISEYLATIPNSFFDNNVVLAFVLTLPNPGYELELREINVKKRVMTISIDRWISDPDLAYPDCIDYCAAFIALERSDLDGIDSYNVVTVDTRENLATNVNITSSTYFPEEYLENAVAADGKGDLFVIDTEAKADDFAALNIQEEYSRLDVGDYLNSLPDGFFDEKAVLVSVIECGAPNKGFSRAVVTKAYGELTTEIYYTVESEIYECILVYYITLIEIDKALLNSTTAYNVIVRDVTEYESIPYTARDMNGFISYEDMKKYDAFDYATINDIDELEGFLEVCDSTDFQEYVDTLADNFFDNKVLVVVPYNEFMYGLDYIFGDIEDVCEGEGTYWRMNITTYIPENGSQKNNKLLVYEIDKKYGNVVFHPYITHDKSPDLFEYEDITIGLSSMSYLFLKRNYFGNYPLNEKQLNNADVNKNGVIDPMDYLIVKRCYFGQYTFS